MLAHFLWNGSKKGLGIIARSPRMAYKHLMLCVLSFFVRAQVIFGLGELEGIAL